MTGQITVATVVEGDGEIKGLPVLPRPTIVDSPLHGHDLHDGGSAGGVFRIVHCEKTPTGHHVDPDRGKRYIPMDFTMVRGKSGEMPVRTRHCIRGLIPGARSLGSS